MRKTLTPGARCDRIYVIHDGTIAEEGTFDELVSTPGSLLLQMGAAATPRGSDKTSADEGEDGAKHEQKDSLESTEGQKVSKAPTTDAIEKGNLVEKEDRKYGKVELATYGRYLRSGASDLRIALLLLVGYGVPELMGVGSQLWLSRWSAASMEADGMVDDVLYYQVVYAVLALGAMVLLLLRSWDWASIVVKAASRLHEQLLASILRQPVSFFDRTPTGRILNRFSHDIDQIDALVSRVLSSEFEFAVRLAVGGSVIGSLAHLH
jgi:ABC-type multidrug transport system fused ATPase/permease subunit